MNTRRSQIASIIIMSVLLFGLAVYSWLKPQDDFSYSERRHLSKRPELTIQNLLAGGNNSFMKQFEDYAADQFPFREAYRTVYSVTSLYGLAEKEINDIYLKSGHAVKIEYPLNQESVDWALERFSEIQEKYLEKSRVYVCIIPDKNYFLADVSGHPALDYEDLFSAMQEGTKEYAAWVDLTGLLEIKNYYYTDTHWRQESLKEIASYLCGQMGAEAYAEYETVTTDIPFYGVYYGQAALPLAPDTLSYLTNQTMEGLQISCLDSGKPEEIPLYDMEKAVGKDGYEMFLGGSRSLIILENPNAADDRELVVFRDSFASSLAPLLTCGYQKVTLVDIRYISPSVLGNYVDFEDADVLFLYSTTLLNSAKSQLMK